MAQGESRVTHLFCFGLGYSARVLSARLLEQGWHITGTSTTADGAHRITVLGERARGLVFDGVTASAEVGEALQSATHMLTSIPPDKIGDPALRLHRADLARASDLSWIGYLSTIGVYGDWQGAWIDEETPPRPQSPRSIQRLDAENTWLDFGAETGKRVQVFRLPGIYGPGRSAIDNVRAGKARRIIKPGQVFNRIHVFDIATALMAAMSTASHHAIYNLTDDEPAPNQDVVQLAAELLGAPVPPDEPFESAGLSLMAGSFYSESKRVRNRRMKDDLGVTLAFPTYREGLRQIASR